jgi:hypothetical protein
MKKFFVLAFALCTISLVVSCKKDPETTSTTNTVTTNNTSYQPLTKGSTWTYKSSAAPGNGEYTITATGNTKVIKGKTYQILTSTASPTGEIYVRLDGENVYEYGKQDINGSPFEIENLSIKPAAAVNATWDDKSTLTSQGFSYDVIYRKTIKEKGVTRKVNNKEYKDVIVIERITLYNFSGTPTEASKETLYYAKGIGAIEQVSDVVNSSLLSANIK